MNLPFVKMRIQWLFNRRDIINMMLMTFKNKKKSNSSLTEKNQNVSLVGSCANIHMCWRNRGYFIHLLSAVYFFACSQQDYRLAQVASTILVQLSRLRCAHTCSSWMETVSERLNQMVQPAQVICVKNGLQGLQVSTLETKQTRSTTPTPGGIKHGLFYYSFINTR